MTCSNRALGSEGGDGPRERGGARRVVWPMIAIRGRPKTVLCNAGQGGREAMRPFPVRVTFRDVDRSAALEAKLRRRAERLAPLAREVLACGVVVEALRRGWRRRRLFRVQVELAVPGEDVIARNDVNDEDTARDPYAAAREAFEAAERQLLARVRRSRPRSMPGPRLVEARNGADADHAPAP